VIINLRASEYCEVAGVAELADAGSYLSTSVRGCLGRP